MSLKFLIDEREAEKEEAAANRKNKGYSLWMAIIFDTWVSYAFWGLVITSLTMLCRPILYRAEVTNSLWVELLLRTIVAIIAVFNVAVIYTWIVGSEFWRRFKCWCHKF